jgi:hypothetical protein
MVFENLSVQGVHEDHKKSSNAEKLSGTIFHASLEEVNHTDVVYKSGKKMVFRDALNQTHLPLEPVHHLH